jgi:hypothetical protein
MSAFDPLQTLKRRHYGEIRKKALMQDELEQGALFAIEGPDEDGCVWICSAKRRGDWCGTWGLPTSWQRCSRSGWHRSTTGQDCESTAKRGAPCTRPSLEQKARQR